MREIESSFEVAGASSAGDLSTEQRLALLTEWRDALIKIIDADPSAVATRKRIDIINDEIAALRCACILPELD